MTLDAIDWLTISINLLLGVFVIVCLLMTLVILMQRPKQEGLGAAFGAGVTDQVFGARTTNVLQRGTVYLGSLFFILSLVLAVLIGHKNKKTSLLKDQTPAAKVEKTDPEKPAEPVKPKSLSDELPAENPAPVVIPEPAPADAASAPVPAPVVEPAPPADAPKPADPTAPADKPGQP
jgi:preprotein translocase subunit SecG